jgi:hypothetical protein
MNEFRAMKMVRKEVDKNLAVNIHVEFDKTKHLSDVSIRRRKVVRERLIAKDRAAEEDEKKKQLAEEEKKEKERFLYFDISFSLQFNCNFSLIWKTVPKSRFRKKWCGTASYSCHLYLYSMIHNNHFGIHLFFVKSQISKI